MIIVPGGVCEKNGISRGEGGPFCEADFGKSRGEGVIGKIPSVGGGMDIFWNYTFWLFINNQFSILVI